MTARNALRSRDYLLVLQSIGLEERGLKEVKAKMSGQIQDLKTNGKGTTESPMWPNPLDDISSSQLPTLHTSTDDTADLTWVPPVSFSRSQSKTHIA